MIARALIILACSGFPLVLHVHAAPVKLGATLALSGDGAEWGKNAQRGIELAVEKVNLGGGIRGDPIEVLFEDYRSSDFKLAAHAAQKFIAVDKVRAILTQWSGDTEVVWPIATRANILTICIGPASDDLTKSSPFLFRVWPSDESLVTAAVDYAARQGHTRAVVVSAADSYFADLTTRLKKHWKEKIGGELPTHEVAQRGMDFAVMALNIKRFDPDVLFVNTSYDVEGIFLKRLREIGVRSVVIGTQRSDDPAVISVAGKSAEGLIYPQYSDSEPGFRAEFKAKFHDEPRVPAEYAYDAVMLLARAMQAADVFTADSLYRELRWLRNYAGASGMVNFDQAGNRTGKTVEMRIIRDGRGALLEAK